MVFGIVTDCKNTVFQKQTAFVFSSITVLRISNNLTEPKTYKFICKGKAVPLQAWRPIPGG
jgi:hypothetical protein